MILCSFALPVILSLSRELSLPMGACSSLLFSGRGWTARVTPLLLLPSANVLFVMTTFSFFRPSPFLRFLSDLHVIRCSCWGALSCLSALYLTRTCAVLCCVSTPLFFLALYVVHLPYFSFRLLCPPPSPSPHRVEAFVSSRRLC